MTVFDTLKRFTLCPLGFHAPSEGRSMGTSIARKHTKPWAMFRYDYDCPRCHRTYTRWS